jgi:outer membrane protein OmpA-like peptidoglycan-associated protein
MNTNVLLGTISFVIWSAFSTWLYVNYIKDFDDLPQNEQLMVQEEVSEAVVEVLAVDSATVEVLAPITLSKSFTFHKNTTDLMHAGAIKQYADSLETLLSDRTVSVNITGYTCNLGTEAYNQQLGLERANYVMTVLKQSNITWPDMTTSSKGETDPLVPNTSENNRIKNRRVTILINSKP